MKTYKAEIHTLMFSVWACNKNAAIHCRYLFSCCMRKAFLSPKTRKRLRTKNKAINMKSIVSQPKNLDFCLLMCGNFLSYVCESAHLTMQTFSSLANNFRDLMKYICGLSDGKCVPLQGRSLAY